MIRDAGPLDEAGFRNLAKLCERIAAGKEPGLARAHGARREGTTIKELAEDWTTGKLAREYPDHVRVKKSTSDDVRMLKWLGDVRMPDRSKFGDRAVATVSLDDSDHVMSALPKTTQSSASRRQYAQALRKLLVYAVYPLRILPVLPIPKGWLPKGRSEKGKAWIYPSDDLALMKHGDIPVARRLLFGLLVREGMRVSEALAITWPDLDLE